MQVAGMWIAYIIFQSIWLFLSWYFMCWYVSPYRANRPWECIVKHINAFNDHLLNALLFLEYCSH